MKKNIINKIKNLFKPSWIVIEVCHERHTFDTYYTYCRHMVLEEVEDMLNLDRHHRKIDKNGAYTYDDETGCCGQTYTYDDYIFTQYHINYTIIIPAHNIKKDQYFVIGNTINKFGLFDKIDINSIDK